MPSNNNSVAKVLLSHLYTVSGTVLKGLPHNIWNLTRPPGAWQGKRSKGVGRSPTFLVQTSVFHRKKDPTLFKNTEHFWKVPSVMCFSAKNNSCLKHGWIVTIKKGVISIENMIIQWFNDFFDHCFKIQSTRSKKYILCEIILQENQWKILNNNNTCKNKETQKLYFWTLWVLSPFFVIKDPSNTTKAQLRIPPQFSKLLFSNA